MTRSPYAVRFSSLFFGVVQNYRLWLKGGSNPPDLFINEENKMKKFLVILMVLFIAGMTSCNSHHEQIEVPPMEKVYEDEYVVQYRIYYVDISGLKYNDRYLNKLTGKTTSSL